MIENNSELDALGLGLDLAGVDTSRPTLPENLYVLNISNVEVKENKQQTGQNLVVTFETTSETMDSRGQQLLQPGYKITKYYPLQQSDKPTAPDYRADLARLQDAVEGTTKDNRPPFNPFQYVGMSVVAKVKIRKDDEYGEQNEISKLEHPNG